MKVKLFSCLFLIALLTGCNETEPKNSETGASNSISEQDVNSNRSDVSLIETPSTLDDLAKISPIVITAKVSGDNEEFVYKDVTFYKTKVKVKDILRDESQGLDKNSEITILQNDVYLDPKVKKNEKVLLYLVKYQGPVIEDAYRIVGLTQGHFKYTDDGKITSKAIDFDIEKNTRNTSLDAVDSSLDRVPYEDNSREPRTQEEIDALNEAENKLPEIKEDNTEK